MNPAARGAVDAAAFLGVTVGAATILTLAGGARLPYVSFFNPLMMLFLIAFIPAVSALYLGKRAFRGFDF